MQPADFHITLGFDPADVHHVPKGRSAVLVPMEAVGLGGDGRPLPSEEVARQYDEYLAWSAQQSAAGCVEVENESSESDGDSGDADSHRNKRAKRKREKHKHRKRTGKKHKIQRKHKIESH